MQPLRLLRGDTKRAEVDPKSLAQLNALIAAAKPLVPGLPVPYWAKDRWARRWLLSENNLVIRKTGKAGPSSGRQDNFWIERWRRPGSIVRMSTSPMR